MTKQAAALVGLIEAVEKYDDDVCQGPCLIESFCNGYCLLRNECNAETHEACIKYASEWDGVL
jgi:hypothetical protein